jgi:arsenate reductase
MTTLYGINNCDTVKKTQKWLTTHNVDYAFHDFRKDGFSESLLSQFFQLTDWNNLLNKRSTTFRNLDESIKKNLTKENVFKAMLEQPTLIKRPVLIKDGQLTVGFKEDNYQTMFS